MRPLTETVPKPMLHVCGRPFLDYQIELLKANGIRRFVLLVGYLGEVIEEYLGKSITDGTEIAYSYEAHPLGTGGALKHAAQLLEEEFLVVNGDTLLDIDYAALVAQFRQSRTVAMVAACPTLNAQVPGNLVLDSAGIVLEYSKQQAAGDHVDAGVLALKKSALALIPELRACSLEQEVFPKLIEARQMCTWRTEKTFYDMGTPNGFAALEKHLRAAYFTRSVCPKC